jgi:hypothetical protein
VGVQRGCLTASRSMIQPRRLFPAAPTA